jgi:agmatine deiminase
VLAAALVWTVTASAGATPTAAPAAPAPSARSWAPTWIRAAPHSRHLRHRGDWERADAVAVVHHWEWASHITRLARMAARWAQVIVLIEGDEANPPRFRPRPGDRGRVKVLRQGTDTPWIRDYGPLQVFDRGQPRWLDFAYADDRWRDDRVPLALASHFEMPLQPQHLRFDGGAIASNGLGLCAVTDYSLGEAGFTPGDPVLSTFAARLGCQVMAVLPALPGESTGHVDVFVQFLGAQTVAVGQMHESWEPRHAAALDASAQILERAAVAIGQSLRVVRVPIVAGGEDAFYTYINGIAVGDVFFMPSYSTVRSATQALARRTLRHAMPGKRIVDVGADEMIAYGGALHCLATGLSLRKSTTRFPSVQRNILNILSGRRL